MTGRSARAIRVHEKLEWESLESGPPVRFYRLA
jgi:hypothetical protein